MHMNSKACLALGVVSASVMMVPAHAVGLGDIAGVVLKGSSVLKKGEQKCGKSLRLTHSESALLSQARNAVFKSISAAEFTKLDADAEASADTSAQSPTFCPETKAKKKGILAKVKKAGKAILAGGKLFGI